MPRAQSSQPTIRETLDGRIQLTPAVRGGNSTYVEARPGRVDYDRFAGQNWRYLGAVLADYDPSLRSLHRKAVDEKIMEDRNAGTLFFENNPELTKNMEAWRKACLDNPEVLNMSPYVKNWITRSVLNTEVMNFESKLKRDFVTSGMRNNANADEVQTWMRNSLKGFMDEHKINVEDTEWDGIDIAANFSHPAMQAMDNVFNLYTREREIQNKDKAVQALGEWWEMRVATGATDAMLFKSQNVPRDRAETITSLVTDLQEKARELSETGVRDSDILPILHDLILKSNLPVTMREALAENTTWLVDGKEVSVSSLPGVAKYFEEEKDRENEKAFKAESRARTRKEWAKKDAVEKAAQAGFDAQINGETDLSPENLRNKYNITTPWAAKAFTDSFNIAASVPDSSPESLMDMEEIKSGIYNGTVGLGNLNYYLKEGLISSTQYQTLTPLLHSENKEYRKSVNSAMNNIGESYVSTLTGLSKEEAKNLSRQLQMTGEIPPQYREYADALAILPDIQRNFLAVVEAEEEKNGQNRLTSAQLSTLTSRFISDNIGSKVRERVEQQEMKRKNAERLRDSKQMTDVADKMKPIPGSTFNPLKLQPLRAYHQGVNTRLRGILPDPSVLDDSFFNLDAPDAIRTLARTDAGTWQNMFYVLTGTWPESMGITSCSEAMQQLKVILESAKLYELH